MERLFRILVFDVEGVVHSVTSGVNDTFGVENLTPD
jgi:hypothetical protein